MIDSGAVKFYNNIVLLTNVRSDITEGAARLFLRAQLSVKKGEQNV